MCILVVTNNNKQNNNKTKKMPIKMYMCAKIVITTKKEVSNKKSKIIQIFILSAWVPKLYFLKSKIMLQVNGREYIRKLKNPWSLLYTQFYCLRAIKLLYQLLLCNFKKKKIPTKKKITNKSFSFIYKDFMMMMMQPKNQITKKKKKTPLLFCALLLQWRRRRRENACANLFAHINAQM